MTATNMTTPHKECPPISISQLAILTATGISLWFVAVLLLRFLGPFGIFHGYGRMLTYLLIIPGTLPFVYLVKWVAGLRSEQLVAGFSLATAAALLCDGLALAWTPTLYGPDTIAAAGAGATILWGAGVGIFLAYILSKNTPQ